MWASTMRAACDWATAYSPGTSCALWMWRFSHAYLSTEKRRQCARHDRSDCQAAASGIGSQKASRSHRSLMVIGIAAWETVIGWSGWVASSL